MRAPNCSSNARRISTAIAAPPDTQRRSLDRSREGALSACSSAVYIVGTPRKIVAPPCSMMSSARSASNRGSSDSVAPESSAAFMPTLWPNAWNRQSAHHHVVGPHLHHAVGGHERVPQEVVVRERRALR